jgi:hypothetical protein
MFFGLETRNNLYLGVILQHHSTTVNDRRDHKSKKYITNVSCVNIQSIKARSLTAQDVMQRSAIPIYQHN